MIGFSAHTICTLCSSSSASAICPSCKHLFIPLYQQRLETCICGAILYGKASHCLACLQEPPYFHKVFAGYRYAFPLNQLLIHYKHLRQHTTEACLKQLWLQHVLHIAPLPEVLVPIPLHFRRRWRRGFNQAERLAKFAAQELQLPCVPLLKKHIHTQSQQGKTRRERKQNIQGSFSVRKPFNFHHIALVDDVITTGSTANEAAQALITLGARRVDIWALARAF